jgi:urease accessory protein
VLDLAFERRGARTILTRRRFTLPLQALEPVDLDGSGAATLMLLNPTGGVLGGDSLATRVHVGAGAHVCLTTPAATRVYRSSGPVSTHAFEARVEEDARLEYVPDHLILSPGARLRQTTEVSLARGSALILADAWAIGREARGERWCFDRLDLGLAVRDERGAILRERAILDRVARDGLGGTEGFAYVATFAAIAPSATGWDALGRDLFAALAEAAPDARYGVGSLARGGLIARLLCPSAIVLDASVRGLWTICRRTLFGLGPAALRKL